VISRGRVIAIAFALLIAVLAPVGAALSIFPVSARLAAPLACPAETATAVVVAEAYRSGNSSKLRWDLYCLTDKGEGSIASTFRVVLGLAAIWAGVLLALFVILKGRNRLRKRRAAATRDHAT
jgi:hypothetical protein